VHQTLKIESAFSFKISAALAALSIANDCNDCCIEIIDIIIMGL
jgi:hypothetical protein